MARNLEKGRTIHRGQRALALVEEALAGPLDEKVLQASIEKNLAFVRDLQKKLASEAEDA